MDSYFQIFQLMYFWVTCKLYEYGHRGSVCGIAWVILAAAVSSFIVLWFSSFPGTGLIICFFISLWAIIVEGENQLRWKIREWSILRATCDDVSAFKAEAKKAQIFRHLPDSDLLRLQPVEEWVEGAEQLLGKVGSFNLTFASRGNFIRKALLSLQYIKLEPTLRKDISQHLQRLIWDGIQIYESLDKSMSMLRRQQGIAAEDESGSAIVRPVAALVSSVLDKVNDFTTIPRDPHFDEFVLRRIELVRWKMMLLEAFLKDLEYVKLESAIAKAWIEEARVLTGDVDQAINTFTQRIGKTGFQWFSKPNWFLAWPRLLHEMDWVAHRLDRVLNRKDRYDFKFIRRQQRAHPYQKDIADINQVQSRLKEITDNIDLMQERFPTLDPSRHMSNPCNSLKSMLELLEHVKAIEGASNLRLFCVEQMRYFTYRAEKAIGTRRIIWTMLSKETKLIEPLIDVLQKSIMHYGIEQSQNSVLGLEEDTDTLVSRLTNGAAQSNIFSIVGMQGTGKTTLANKVYHHRTILSEFPRRAWAFLRESSSDVNVLLEIVGKQITGINDLPEEGNGREYWVQKIQSFLLEERYLVVLDNISSTTVWDTLKDAFPERSNGRILLITRLEYVASHADPNNPPHRLRLRTKEESWVLFQEKAQFRPDLLPQEMLEKKLKEVVGRCGGLPLTISCLGSLMSKQTPNDQEMSRALEQVNDHRELWSESFSNNDLPPHQKALLAYFTLFPKNFEIPVRRLIALWVAEGVVQQSANEEMTLENTAEKYLLELIGLNIIQPVENYASGKVKICRLPDCLWDDVSSMSTDSSQRQLADHCDNSNATFQLIHGVGKSPHAEWQRHKGLLSFISFDTRDGDKPGEDIGNFLSQGIANGCFLELRVLDLEHVFRPKLPKTIGNMVELRYLGLRWTFLEEIPSTIGNLMNLQTLDMKHTYVRTLPYTIWKLQKLRHLYLNHTSRSKLAHQSKTRSMQNLQTLWGAFLDKNSPLKDTIDELKSLRNLKLVFQLGQEDQKGLAKRVANLQHLQSLRLSSIDVMGEPLELYLEDYSGLQNLSDMYLFGRLESVSVLAKLADSLSDLTLSASGLQDDPMPILEKLPNLRSLSLLSDSFLGEHMVCSTKTFPKLLVLKLWNLRGLREWKIEEDAIQNLKKLEIRSCKLLKVPIGLKHLKNLRGIKLKHMAEEFVSTVAENKGPIWHNMIPDILCE